MKLKGIILAVILSLASIMMPFDVYAAVQSQIVPTFSSTTSQWSTHLSVTNFSDGTNNQASSTLSFTFDDDYYGMVYFDGYGPSNQHIANYAVCFIAGGYGEYRYSYYQNGVINITSVTVQIVNVVKPDSTVDLTQIIALLTAIETDTSSIDLLVNQTKTQIINVLNQLVLSNGYLEELTNLKQFNMPIESYGFNILLMRAFSQYMYTYNFNYFNYPIYSIPVNSNIIQFSATENFKVIMYCNKAISAENISNYLSITGTNENYTYDYRFIPLFQNTGRCFELTFHKTGTTAVVTIKNVVAMDVIGIFEGVDNGLFSTDFALLYGLSNKLLDNIQLIANGTTSSNSAASDLESGNSQMADDMDDLATIESGYNQQFNNQLQSIDFTSPIQNNAGILPAANFVISIFNGLINNNPFSVLIIVVCILLIGKKVIGK